ncbi:MAG: hydroxymethylbilane synthase [Phycisphaerae bacterium]|jgi:hydroxymethylbilane synthase
MKPILIGTRGSPLALWQAEYLRSALLAANPALKVELEIIRTAGDKILGEPQQAALSKGMFTKELETALLGGAIDLAVHSLKDLPTELPEGLDIAAITAREDPADALISRDGLTLDHLPRGAKVLAGSPRRRAQLLHYRGDLQVLPIRGNVGTRLRKFEESGADGIVFAMAGLKRLGLGDRVTQRLDPVEFPPGCGQGALAVEIRRGDRVTAGLVSIVDDPLTRIATTAERAFLAALGGGCLMPAGAYGRSEDGGATLTLTGMLASPDGSACFQDTVSAPCTGPQAAALGAALADKFRAAGAAAILEQLEQARTQAPEGQL